MAGKCFASRLFGSCLSRDQSKFQNTPRFKPLTLALDFSNKVKRELSNTIVISGCQFILLVLFLPAPALSAEVSLAWDPNRETDLAGYCAYYNSGNSTPHFSLSGCITLNELRDSNNPQIKLTGLNQGYHCFAVTAFNTRGDESGYSNSVCAQIRERAMPWLIMFLLDE